jgi:hypothetical protein
VLLDAVPAGIARVPTRHCGDVGWSSGVELVVKSGWGKIMLRQLSGYDRWRSQRTAHTYHLGLARDQPRTASLGFVTAHGKVVPRGSRVRRATLGTRNLPRLVCPWVEQ